MNNSYAEAPKKKKTRSFSFNEKRAWTPEEAAQLEAMKNVLRHSFATYHLAAYKDAKLTAYLMTKTSIQSLNNDYRGRASQAQGLEYFQIAPPVKL